MVIDKKMLVRDIKKLSSMLSKAKNVEEYKYIKSNLDILLDIYRNLYFKECPISISRNLIYEAIIGQTEESVPDKIAKEYLSDREFYNQIATTVFTSIPNDLKTRYEEPILRMEDFKKLVEGFFSFYGDRLYSLYKKLLNDGCIDLLSYKEDGMSATSNIFMLNKSYVQLTHKLNIDGCLTFVHEIAHAYANSLLKDHEQAYNDSGLFVEFFSSFIERLFIIYLEDNEMFDNILIPVINKNNITLRTYAHFVRDFNDRSEDFIEKFKPNLSYSLVNFYSKYLSAIKECDYLKDSREGTIERIEDFLRQQGKVTTEESLDILGIDYEELKSGNKLKRLLKLSKP